MQRPAAKKPNKSKEPTEPKTPKKPKGSKEPKKPKGGKKAKDPKTPKGNARKRKSPMPSPADKGEETEVLSEKEKRRVRAAAAFDKLKQAAVVGLELPSQLNGRISFTVKNPRGFGSSVGVILASESFYISKAVPPPEWPTTCTHLKVG